MIIKNRGENLNHLADLEHALQLIKEREFDAELKGQLSKWIMQNYSQPNVHRQFNLVIKYSTTKKKLVVDGSLNETIFVTRLRADRLQPWFEGLGGLEILLASQALSTAVKFLDMIIEENIEELYRLHSCIIDSIKDLGDKFVDTQIGRMDWYELMRFGYATINHVPLEQENMTLIRLLSKYTDGLESIWYKSCNLDEYILNFLTGIDEGNAPLLDQIKLVPDAHRKIQKYLIKRFGLGYVVDLADTNIYELKERISFGEWDNDPNIVNPRVSAETLRKVSQYYSSLVPESDRQAWSQFIETWSSSGLIAALDLDCVAVSSDSPLHCAIRQELRNRPVSELLTSDLSRSDLHRIQSILNCDCYIYNRDLLDEIDRRLSST